MNVAQLIVQLTDAIRENPDVANYTVQCWAYGDGEVCDVADPEYIAVDDESKEVWISE